jgi:hypothetical protein
MCGMRGLYVVLGGSIGPGWGEWKERFGGYANVRELYTMKQCLNCQAEFEYKRESAKFCSDKCRAAYNRAHPSQQVTKLQMQLLYNEMMELAKKMQSGPEVRLLAPNTPQQSVALHNAEHPEQMTTIFHKPVPRVAADAIMRKYVEERRDCTCEEEFRAWFDRVDGDERLSSKQKELVKNTI